MPQGKWGKDRAKKNNIPFPARTYVQGGRAKKKREKEKDHYRLGGKTREVTQSVVRSLRPSGLLLMLEGGDRGGCDWVGCWLGPGGGILRGRRRKKELGRRPPGMPPPHSHNKKGGILGTQSNGQKFRVNRIPHLYGLCSVWCQDDASLPARQKSCVFQSQSHLLLLLLLGLSAKLNSP